MTPRGWYGGSVSKKPIDWTLTEADGIRPLDADGPPPVRSVEAEDLGVVFQPIVDTTTHRTEAVEVLTRCKLPEYRNPHFLFEEAAKVGYAGRLGRIVRELAFAHALELPVYVNIHPAELTARWLVRPDDPMFLHPHGVYLEITEAAAFVHHDLVRAVLGELSSRGVKLVIDDFGAGHSNLARLADLEPAVVKLDRSLVTDLHLHSRKQNLMRHTISMMHSFDAAIVAEGVETSDELSAVLDCGADFVQGYLLARPANPVPQSIWP
jgi:EAL domain-containing protein (putative c-di-GMP-specific phosphodiesterase class I)